MTSSMKKQASDQRNWAKFQVRGVIRNLARLAQHRSLTEDEVHLINNSLTRLYRIEDKWDAERKRHPKWCGCNECYAKQCRKEIRKDEHS
jgi:hypothetical protein